MLRQRTDFRSLAKDVIFIRDGELKLFRDWLIDKFFAGNHIFSARCLNGRVVVSANDDKVAKKLFDLFVASNSGIMPELTTCNHLRLIR